MRLDLRMLSLTDKDEGKDATHDDLVMEKKNKWVLNQ